MKIAKTIHRTSFLKINSFIGLSVEVSPIDDNAINLVLKQIRGTPVFVLGDSSHRFNNYVFEGKSLRTGKAEELALRSGDNYIKKLKYSLKTLDCNIYKIIRWNELKSDRYCNQIDIANHLFWNNEKFKNLVTDCSLSFAKKRNTNKKLSEKHLWALNSYILEELPLLAFGFTHEEKTYNHLIHPVLNDFEGFPELIKATESFQDLSGICEIPNSITDLVISDLLSSQLNVLQEKFLINY